MSMSRLAVLALAVWVALPTALAREKDDEASSEGRPRARMSSAGRIASEARDAALSRQGIAPRGLMAGQCVNADRCVKQGLPPEVDEVAGPRGGQAETSIAVDETGQHVVLGFNDTRGFSLPGSIISVSGFMYSDDGGKTFVDGGQLPTPGDQTLAGDPFFYPQIYGDPDVKHLGGCNFAYSSIMLIVKELQPGVPTPVQTLSVHRSRDCGHTWEGPFEVTGATNPNGYVYSDDGSAVDAADKEFMDHDARTGRVLVSWTNFTDPAVAPGQVQISTTYSDDLLTATPPTWSSFMVVSAIEADGQASIPRFADDGSTAYVAWRRYPYPGVYQGYGNVTAFARSADGGRTWSAPIETSPEFFTMDQVLGNDRVNTSPSLAVGASRGKKPGALYLVYASNDSGDGADIVFQRSLDGGQTFSQPLYLNSRPGDDRAQWFPWVAVDRTTGRIFVFYYDQGVAESGDLSQVTYTFSDDGGKRWAAPVALSSRTFHAGWGNDTGQPNLGDYNQAVAQRGKVYASFAIASRPPLGFADGQPATGTTVPDAVVAVLPNPEKRFGATPVDLVGVRTFDLGFGGHNGFIDPGESVGIRMTLRNSATNGLFARRLRDLQGVLRTTTPGVRIAAAKSSWPDLRPGDSAESAWPFILFTAPSFVPGTPIELELTVEGDDLERTVVRHTLFTGTPIETLLFTEDFEAPALGAHGWATAHGGGANVVPWDIAAGTPGSPGFCGTASNVAYHQNANDGPPGGSPTRWERLLSPRVAVPPDSEYVTLEFDVCYDTEEDPYFRVLAYDGFFLRITDFTSGRTLRSVLAEAFEDEFTTGELEHYPRHLPRSSNRAYFEDMSAWAGDSKGPKHVRMRLPGLAGSTVQLRFEYTQDSAGTCADLRPGDTCGVSVDNIVMKSFRSAP